MLFAVGEKSVPLVLGEMGFQPLQISSVHGAKEFTQQLAVADGGRQQELAGHFAIPLSNQVPAFNVKCFQAVANQSSLPLGGGRALLQQVLIVQGLVPLLRRWLRDE